MRGTSILPRRLYVSEDSSLRRPPYIPAQFRALVAKPARGAFTMPADGCLRLTAAHGASGGCVGARLTGSTERRVTVPSMHPGGRHLIGQVQLGTRVEPTFPFVVEVEVRYREWCPIAVWY